MPIFKSEIDLSEMGPQGPAGPKGDTGNTGPQGPAGTDLTTPAIHAATNKPTPIDTDELGLIDSEASFGLKKLSWLNLKTTLSNIFALLSGKSGGQTLIGGTGVTDQLTLQGTSGNRNADESCFSSKNG